MGLRKKITPLLSIVGTILFPLQLDGGAPIANGSTMSSMGNNLIEDNTGTGPVVPIVAPM